MAENDGITQCRGITKAGKRCRANVIHGEEYCLFHHPGEEWVKMRADTAKRAGSRGRYRKVVIEADPAGDALFLTESVRTLIEDIQGRAANKRDDALLLRALGEYRQSLEWSYRFSEFEERLNALEEQRRNARIKRR